MKIYIGELGKDGTGRVLVASREGALPQPLRLRLDLFNHSPAGFAWGYGGSGPAQLALAILADALGNGPRAVRLHQSFKWAVVAPLERESGWTMTEQAVRAAVEGIEAEEAEKSQQEG